MIESNLIPFCSYSAEGNKDNLEACKPSVFYPEVQEGVEEAWIRVMGGQWSAGLPKGDPPCDHLEPR